MLTSTPRLKSHRLNPYRWLVPVTVGLIFGLLCAAASYWAAGPSLGLFFGSLALATACVPGLVVAEAGGFAIVLVTVGLIAGVAAGWLPAGWRVPLTAGQWLGCVAVLGSYAVAVAGLTALLAAGFGRSAGGRAAATGLVSLIALAWLTWPLWLAIHLHGTGGEGVARSWAEIHPLLDLNAALRDSAEPWLQSTLIYQMTPLDQHLMVGLPDGIARGCAAHLLIGAPGVAIVCWLDWRRRAAERKQRAAGGLRPVPGPAAG